MRQVVSHIMYQEACQYCHNLDHPICQDEYQVHVWCESEYPYCERMG